MNKKDLQKTIKSIRDEISKGSYPKPMMAKSQMAINTATVNCGSVFDKEDHKSKKIAQLIMDDQRFKDLLVRNNSKAVIETTSDGYQIRISY